ncbi:MAG: ADP-ribose pyrophosphatase [Chloroflexi bacterium HGW-Chloroflexi-4]|jgi:ADP-ribose pyrophosphatase|nr:MAG: ADP-ribose pyrophosphatase [Chloroflexi bacterium HGW-Chloroflexi-4]
MADSENTSQTVFTAKLFKVKNIDLPLPDGNTKTYEMIDIQNAITVLPVDSEGCLYFVEQFRIGAGKPLLELPAGKIESDEDPLEAARRELREEIGMDATEIKTLGNFYMSPGYTNEYMYCFLATGLFPAPLAPDIDEFIKVKKLQMNQVFELIESGKLDDSKTLAVLTLAQKHLK